MGYMRSHAIVVSAFYGNPHWIEVAHKEAVRIFHQPVEEWSAMRIAEVTDPTHAGMNGIRSFMVAPDGSKEGWGHSDAGDRARHEFVSWLESAAYDDGSSPLAWVEVQFGDDEWATMVINDNDARRRAGEYRDA